MPIPPLAWLLLARLASAPELEDPPASELPPTLTVSFRQPDHQLQTMLGWFKGSQHRSPASVLASLRAHSGNPGILNKGVQAAIAMLNPEMIHEIRVLDGSVGKISFPPGASPTWWLRIPEDDGLVRTFASALSLGEGTQLPPSEPINLAVDRLGPAGAPLLIQQDQLVILGSESESLQKAISENRSVEQTTAEGFCFELVSVPLSKLRQTDSNTVIQSLQTLGIQSITGRSSLNADGLQLDCRSRLANSSESAPKAQTEFYKDFMGRLSPGTVVAGVTALDPSGRSVRTLYSLGDRVLVSQGGKPGQIPLRTRVNLAAGALGLFPEQEIWPKVDGLGGSMAMDQAKPVSALLALHTTEPEFAPLLAQKLAKTLRRVLSSGKPAQDRDEPGADRDKIGDLGILVGNASGKPIRISVDHGTIWVTWGTQQAEIAPNAAEAAPETVIVPEKATRLVQVWPGRLLIRNSFSPEVCNSLELAPSMVWMGWQEGAELVDQVRWGPLPPTIRAIVDTIPPLDPLP